ncbi:hypothetical protein CR513_26221, partial [Mucuna pruriens]
MCGWVELLHEKFESVNAFKTFKVVTKLKLEIPNLLQGSHKIVVLRNNKPCLAHLNKMGLLKAESHPYGYGYKSSLQMIIPKRINNIWRADFINT